MNKFKSVELFPNSKNPKYAWKKTNEFLIELNLSKYIEYRKSGKVNANYSLRTGKINNLSVIDLDKNKETGEGIDKNIFCIKFGSDPEKWAEDYGALVVKTPSGGYHLYFQYEESLKHGQDSVSNIDIRNDGGLIISAGVQRNGGEYEVVAGDINKKLNKVNEEVLEFIHSIDYYNPAIGNKNTKKTYIKIKKIKSKDGKKEILIEEIIGCDQSLYIYDYSDFMINNIIKGLPEKYFNDYHFYLLFATAMKQIDRQDIYDEYPKLNNPRGGSIHSEEHKIWLLDLYDNIRTGHKTILAFNHLLINSEYKNARTTLDYYKYKPVLENKIISDIKFVPENEAGKLGYEFFQNIFKVHAGKIEGKNKKFIIVKSDMGTGKTTSFKSYMKSRNKPFISIVSRISLGLEQYETFNTAGIETSYYEYSDFEPDDNFIVQIDSLLKLRYFNSTGYTDGYTLFLDEFNSIIKYLFTSDTLNKNGIRIPVMELLVDLIKNAERVIMTDADISDPAVQFIEHCVDKEEILFIENEYKHNKDKPAEEVFSIDALVELMKKEPKFICPCDEARTCHLLKEMIGDDKILIVDRNTTERHNWDEHDRIIFSPKVIYGLDSTMKRPVFCLYQESTIDPRDMLQQINRNRSITKLWYLFQRKKCRDCAFNTFEDCEEDTRDIKKWCERNDYLQQSITSLHPLFQKIYNQFKYNKDCYDTNPYAHFKSLLKIRGFKNVTIISQSNSKHTKELLKADKERIIENIRADLPFVVNMNEYIGLPYDEIENHKEAFADGQFIGRYLSASHYLFRDYGEEYNVETGWEQGFASDIERLENQKKDMKDKIYEKEEFNIKKIKMTQNKLIFIDKLREQINSKDRMNIENIEVMNENEAKNFYEEYKVVFTDRSKKDENPFMTEYGTQKLLNKVYKNIFGASPFQVSSTSIQGKSIQSFKNGTYEEMNKYKECYEIYKKSREEFARKKKEEYDARNSEPGYQFESDEE